MTFYASSACRTAQASPSETCDDGRMAFVVIICWLLALIFFALAALAIPPHPRFQWIAGGLFFFTLAEFLLQVTGVSAKIVSA